MYVNDLIKLYQETMEALFGKKLDFSKVWKKGADIPDELQKINEEIWESSNFNSKDRSVYFSLSIMMIEDITQKLQPFNKITTEMENLYRQKNRRYGNSFSKLYHELGLVSAKVQIGHKYSRLLNTQEEEAAKDTLIDMANYCIMTLMEIKKNE